MTVEQINSGHRAEVFVVEDLDVHPNADKLDILKWEGWQTCVQKGSFKKGDLAVFIPPDTLAPISRPEFDFLTKDARQDGKARIKAKKLRGVPSFGLAVPAPAGSVAGQDVYDTLGLAHYEPIIGGGPNQGKPGINLAVEDMPGPSLVTFKYDLENFRRYGKKMFEESDDLMVHEKLHGCLQADSLVLMGDGSEKPIKDVHAGDTVISYDTDTGQFEKSVVTGKFVQPPTNALKWVRLTMQDGRTLELTEDHRVLTTEGWKEAGDLVDGDDLVSV